MRHAAIIGMTVAGLLAAPALAACPPPTPGDTPAEIRANADRLVCLQQDISANTERRRQQLEIDALNNRLRDLEVQRRFDNLPKPPVIVVQPPANL